jgi:tetratricopeptide (TPR) repeat protein
MLSRVANDLKCPLSSSDMGVLAYAYSLSGKEDEALKWAEKALESSQSSSEKAQADFRLYQIKSRLGYDSQALRSLEAVMEYSNSVEMASLMKSVASSRKDFLDQQHSVTQHRLRSTRLSAAFVLLSLMSVVFAMLGYIRYRKLEAAKLLGEERAETEKYMNIAEDLQAKLKTASKRLPSEKHMSIARFDVLERLCEQYYVYEGTPNLQDKVLKEVKSVIQGLRDDPKMLKGLELMLDRNCGEIVKRLKEQLPKLKEEDTRLFIFAASGFSSTTISTILEKDKGIVYNRIWRLKGKIASSDAHDKDDFLAILNA